MSNWLDFSAIKQNVGIEPLLRHYRVVLRRCGRDQLRGRCPIHQGDGEDAFHVNLTRNIFHCFACGAGGTVLDFVAAMEACSLRDAAEKLYSITSVDSASLNRKQRVTEKRSALAPLGFVLRNVDNAHPYLATRGITCQTATDFGVGFYSGPGLLSRRLVIPIHDARGRLVAYCGRSLDASLPRYRFPPRFAKSEVLFNFHRTAASKNSFVVVVEGFFDCFKIHQAGVHSVVALMGAALYKVPERLLAGRFQNVLLMLDGDATGRAAAQTIANALQRFCSVRAINLPAGQQPDNLSEDSIRGLLHPILLELGSAG